MANVPTVSHDETKPAGTRDINLGDDDFREFKTQVREIIAVDHKMLSSGQGTDWGYHKAIHIIDNVSDPSESGVLYRKDDDLYYKDGDGDVIRITSAGAMAGALSTGLIVIWTGTIANIPSGWVICDGNNSTPNLLDKFVCGVATAATNPGTTGGAATHTHGAGSYAGPSHTHTGTTDTTVGGGASGDYSSTLTHNSHTHTFTSAAGGTGAVTGTSAAGSTLPPYYAVAFIMKS